MLTTVQQQQIVQQRLTDLDTQILQYQIKLAELSALGQSQDLANQVIATLTKQRTAIASAFSSLGVS